MSAHRTRRGQSATTNAILDELEQESGSTTKELAAATNLTVGTVHGYLMPLCSLGLVACTKLGAVNSWRLVRRPLPTWSDRLLAAYSPGEHWSVGRIQFGANDVAARFGMTLSKACRLLRSMESEGLIARVNVVGKRKYTTIGGRNV